MTKKAGKPNRNLVIVLASIVAVLVIGGIVAVVAINSNNTPKEETVTAEDLMREAENERIDAIVTQVKLKADIYAANHGKYAPNLRYFIDDPSYLDQYNVVYTATDDGFTITYTVADGSTRTLTND